MKPGMDFLMMGKDDTGEMPELLCSIKSPQRELLERKKAEDTALAGVGGFVAGSYIGKKLFGGEDGLAKAACFSWQSLDSYLSWDRPALADMQETTRIQGASSGNDERVCISGVVLCDCIPCACRPCSPQFFFVFIAFWSSPVR